MGVSVFAESGVLAEDKPGPVRSSLDPALEALAPRRAAPVHHANAAMGPSRGISARPEVTRLGIVIGGRMGSVSVANRVTQAARDGGAGA